MKNRLFEGIREMDPTVKKIVAAGLGTAALIGTALIFPKSRKALLSAAERSGKAGWAALEDIPDVKERVSGFVDNAAGKLKALGGHAVNLVDTAATRTKTLMSEMNLVGAEPNGNRMSGASDATIPTETVRPQAAEFEQATPFRS